MFSNICITKSQTYDNNAVESTPASRLSILQMKSITEYIARVTIPEEYRTLSAWAHLTTQTAYTGLSYYTVQFIMVWLLTANISHFSLMIITNITWFIGL